MSFLLLGIAVIRIMIRIWSFITPIKNFAKK
jgi:hypothetical protein